MAKHKGGFGNFWRWWRAQLSGMFGLGPHSPELLLELNQEHIRLLERGTRRQLATVELEAPDSGAQMAHMVDLARKFAGSPPPVDVLLPRDQVLIAREEFPANLTHSLDFAAKARVATLSGHDAAELAVDFNRSPRGLSGGLIELVLAAAPNASVEEAIRYAKKWGFQPRRVSVEEYSTEFPNAPEFFLDVTPDPSTRGLRTAAAGLALTALLLFGFAGWRLIDTRHQLAGKLELAGKTAISQPELEQRTLRLRDFAAAALVPAQAREARPPVWSLLNDLAVHLPPDIGLSQMALKGRQITLSGTAPTTEGLLEAIDSAPRLAAPLLLDTKKTSMGHVSFNVQATVVNGG